MHSDSLETLETGRRVVQQGSGLKEKKTWSGRPSDFFAREQAQTGRSKEILLGPPSSCGSDNGLTAVSSPALPWYWLIHCATLLFSPFGGTSAFSGVILGHFLARVY